MLNSTVSPGFMETTFATEGPLLYYVFISILDIEVSGMIYASEEIDRSIRIVPQKNYWVNYRRVRRRNLRSNTNLATRPFSGLVHSDLSLYFNLSARTNF